MTWDEEMAGHYLKDYRKLKINEKAMGSTYMVTVKTVEGSPELVFMKVAEMLEADKWTPMYMHMRLRVSNIEVDMFKVKVTLSKSHYAGD